MNIYVNGSKLDFVLENEKTVYDIVNALSDHYSKEQPQKFITSIIIDDVEYSYADDDGLKNKDISGIEKLSFEFNDIIGVSLLSIRQISLYLDFILEVTERNAWDDALLKVLDSLNWMKQGIEQIVNIFGTDKDDLSGLKNKFMTRYKNLEVVFSSITENDFPLTESKLKEITLYIKDLQGVLNTFFNSLNTAENSIDETALSDDIDTVVEILDKVITLLPNVPVSLQKGDDKTAMEIVQLLTTAIDKSISLFMVFKDSFINSLDSVQINGDSFEVFFGKMTDNLKELMTAMEAKDSVMIGDLVEYEFVPHAEELREILLKLRNNSLSNVN